MKRPAGKLVGLGVLIGVVLGFAFGKGDPIAPLIVGSLGGLLAGLGYCKIQFLRRVCGLQSRAADAWNYAGLLLGIVVGGFIGAYGGLGNHLLKIFNPSLPKRDFEMLFGLIGGSILGAFIGICSGLAFSVLDKNRNSSR